ncbi:MAG TPA: TGS domain-containing protein [bacterium]|nr:TGS domain-containing protein [bacterium]HPG44488.1 TGS domain-containing protein [bacterium]HPM97046.1 TGS domain-containing protein [bacterium]
MELQQRLNRWLVMVSQQLEQALPNHQRTYSEAVNLPHYRHLSLQLLLRFQDLTLAQAAFLHGVPSSEVSAHLQSLVNAEILQILENRELLASLNGLDSDVANQLVINVLPALRDWRSVPLFLFDKLHHLDSDGHLFNWTLRFYQSPALFDVELFQPMRYTCSLTDLLQFSAFTSSVLVKTADYFGLWHERNVLENAALLLHDQARFCNLVDSVLAEVKEPSYTGRICAAIQKTVGSLGQTMWEWRHIAAMDRELSADGHPGGPRSVPKLGYVAVLCRDASVCYQVLGLLHRRCKHRPAKLNDFIGEPTKSGYRALHTVLLAPDDLQDCTEVIPVRLIPIDESNNRFLNSDDQKIANIRHHFSGEMDAGLRVFTPDGRRVDLPVGATVMHFAMTLHSSFVAHLSGATVNRQPVSAFHPLDWGDVVWLDIAKTPQPLPAGWRERLPQPFRKRVIRQFKQFYRPALMAAGRTWLRQQLLARGLQEIPEDEILDLFVEEVATTWRSQNRHPHVDCGKEAHDWWLQQLGILASCNRGMDLPYVSAIDEISAEELVSDMLRTIETANLNLIHELNVPLPLQSRIDSIVLCDQCHPQIPGDNVGKLENRTLRVHRKSAPCGKGGFAVFRQHRARHPHYFLIEFTNRIGAAAEIFEVFNRFHIDIADFAGCRLQRGWSVVRILVDVMEENRIDQVAAALEKIQGVRRVIKPNQPAVPLLESVLPPRAAVQSSALSTPAPYICGNCIVEDAYFYGMERELAQLRDIFNRVNLQGGYKGCSVFVYGPKRSGKSSLVLYFYREIQRLHSQKCLLVYYEASRRQSWKGAEKELNRQICEHAVQMAPFFNIELPPLSDLSLVENMEILQRVLHIPFVLIIDEAIGLLHETTAAEEMESLLDFFDCVAKLPQRMVIWVGPEAPVQFLHPKVRRKLEKAEPVKTRNFELQETFALLRADKFNYRHHIKISHSLARQIHLLTGGHPYWISYLGRLMWQSARQGEITRYTPQLLSRAVEDMLNLGAPFTDRLYSTLDPSQSYHLILKLLAQKDVPEEGLTLTDLRSQLNKTNSDLAEKSLRNVLNILQAQGALHCHYHRRHTTWSLAAPLLGMAIQYHQEPNSITGEKL